MDMLWDYILENSEIRKCMILFFMGMVTLLKD